MSRTWIQVPDTGAFVIALPMKIKGGSGGPLRIVAVLGVPEIHPRRSHDLHHVFGMREAIETEFDRDHARRGSRSSQRRKPCSSGWPMITS